MTSAFQSLMLWLLGSALMAMATMATLSAAYADGQFVPAHNDAFYHARRVLDAVMSGLPVAQFDSHMHVPEGSWVTWPWTFDSAMAAITRLLGPYASEAQANRVLMHIPVFAGAVGVALAVWLARLLRFGFLCSSLLVAAFACLPAVRASFAVGNIDHHFAEILWASLALCAGVWFTREPRTGRAIALGLALGTACGVHMSLFVLQVPLVAFYLLRWLRREPLPQTRHTVVLAASLVVSALFICLPSEPFQRGFFEFYTLSWFHLYVAAGTAGVLIAVTVLRRRALTMVALAVAGAIALLPAIGGLDLGVTFLGGRLDSTQQILEIYSPYRVAFELGDRFPAPPLLYYLWLALPALLFAMYLAATRREADLQYFALAAFMGLTLLQLQARLHVFGDLVLIATPLLAARLATERWPAHAKRIMAVTVVVFVGALVPVRHAWGLRWQLAGAAGYAEIRGVFPEMAEACRARPGILLADTEAGHWVRYHSGCDVIGNLFLLTPQQSAKARETDQLMMLSPAALLVARNDIAYVFAFHNARVDPRREPDLEVLREQLPTLEAALLGPREILPPRFRQIWALDTPGGQPYARLFEIAPP